MKQVTYIVTHPLMVILQAAGGSIFISYLQEATLQALLWFVPCLCFIIADLATGITAAKHRKEKVSFSTAARRTITKCVCYLSWILGAVTCGIQFHSKMTCFFMMALVVVIEATSVISNWLEPKGVVLSWKGVFGLLGDKFGLKNLGDCVKEKEE